MSLFEHYPAAPSAVSAAGQQAIDRAGQLRTVKGSVQSRSASAATNVTGLLVGPISTVSTPAETALNDVAQAALLVGGSMKQFAESITAYNKGIDELNAAYEAAKANDFGVAATSGASQCYADPADVPAGDHEQAVADAGAALRAELLAKKRQLDEDLDAQADDVAATLKAGPSDNAVIPLLAAGYLPMSAVEAFPSIDLGALNTLRGYVGMARGLKGVPGSFQKFYALFKATKDFNEMATELAKTEAGWATMLAAVEKNLDTTTIHSLNLAMKGKEEISLAQYTKLFAEADKYGATKGLMDAAKVTSKTGGFFAVTGLAASTYDLGDLILNGNDGKGGVDTALRATGDATGIVSSGGSLLMMYGPAAAALGPVGAGVIVAAGVVSLGIAVYRNWDSISAGAEKAWNWAGDQVSDAWDGYSSAVNETWDAASDVAGDVVDGAYDTASDLADEAGDLVDSAGDALDDAADTAGDVIDDITPW